MRLRSLFPWRRTSGQLTAPPEVEPPTASAQPWKVKRILLVEDEADERELMQMFLQGKGFECHPAHDCRKAMEMVQRDPFDLVVLDVIMSGAYTPVDFVQELKGLDPLVSIVVVSGISAIELGEMSWGPNIARNADGFVLKGLDSPDRLLSLIPEVEARRRQFLEASPLPKKG